MPFLDITTSARVNADTQPALLADVVRTAAEQLGKPESVTMASLTQATAMHFQNGEEPCCYVDVRLIGLPKAEVTASLCASLTALLSGALRVPAGRVFVVYRDVPRAQWGVGGRMLG